MFSKCYLKFIFKNVYTGKRSSPLTSFGCAETKKLGQKRFQRRRVRDAEGVEGGVCGTRRDLPEQGRGLGQSPGAKRIWYTLEAAGCKDFQNCSAHFHCKNSCLLWPPIRMHETLLLVYFGQDFFSNARLALLEIQPGFSTCWDVSHVLKWTSKISQSQNVEPENCLFSVGLRRYSVPT